MSIKGNARRVVRPIDWKFASEEARLFILKWFKTTCEENREVTPSGATAYDIMPKGTKTGKPFYAGVPLKEAFRQ